MSNYPYYPLEIKATIKYTKDKEVLINLYLKMDLQRNKFHIKF